MPRMLSTAVPEKLLRVNICRICRRRQVELFRRSPFVTQHTRPASSQGSSHPGERPGRFRLNYIPLSLFILPPVLWWLSKSSSPSDLSPSVYSDHPVSSARRVSEQHKEVVVSLPPGSALAFASTSGENSGRSEEQSREISVHHIMVKSPDLMIERPYTPVNDVAADGEIRLVVKRVKGGEVGRLVHSLQPGQSVGLRGPIPTFSLAPTSYDRIIMISSGTGIAPFLQFLAKLPVATASPRLDIIHALPAVGRTDWIADPESSPLPGLQAKHGDHLMVHRFDAGTLPSEQVGAVLEDKTAGERVMVLVCLPPNLMKPLCGPLTITLQQGELTGLLRDLGLSPDQVLKLE